MVCVDWGAWEPWWYHCKSLYSVISCGMAWSYGGNPASSLRVESCYSAPKLFSGLDSLQRWKFFLSLGGWLLPQPCTSCLSPSLPPHWSISTSAPSYTWFTQVRDIRLSQPTWPPPSATYVTCPGPHPDPSGPGWARLGLVMRMYVYPNPCVPRKSYARWIRYLKLGFIYWKFRAEPWAKLLQGWTPLKNGSTELIKVRTWFK